MSLTRPQDLFDLTLGETVTKRSLFDLIQLSKVEQSKFWGGPEFAVGNTPQQGINWIGSPPQVRGVVIKTRLGSYDHDGWVDERKRAYRYSFKARKGIVSLTDTANKVLIAQPQHLYPILLFTERKAEWVFEGQFTVSEIEKLYVTLERDPSTSMAAGKDEASYQEGGIRYVTHLLAERSRSLVSIVKAAASSTCEICCKDFAAHYGVSYIEAHHKVPISTFKSSYAATPEDLALLCPNCHRAVHIYMKQDDHSDYAAIKHLLQVRMHKLVVLGHGT